MIGGLVPGVHLASPVRRAVERVLRDGKITENWAHNLFESRILLVRGIPQMQNATYLDGVNSVMIRGSGKLKSKFSVFTMRYAYPATVVRSSMDRPDHLRLFRFSS